MYKKILVTGMSGPAGTGMQLVAPQYPDREFIFSNSKICDLRNFQAALDYIGRVKPDAIFHMAALSGGVGLSAKRPASLLRDNVLMNFNIMEAARLCRIKKTIMTLSTGMYAVEVPNPIKEEWIHNGPPHESNYSYAFAKRLVEPAIRAYRTEYGLNVIGLVPNGIVGENMNFDPEASTMLGALIRRFCEQREGNPNLVVWGDGSPLREYTSSRDVARAYLWCLDNYDESQILHIGTMEEHSVKEIALMIADFLKIDASRIEFDITKPKGPMRKSADNSRFVSLSGFKYTPFKAALEMAIRWFLSEFPKKSSISERKGAPIPVRG